MVLGAARDGQLVVARIGGLHVAQLVVLVDEGLLLALLLELLVGLLLRVVRGEADRRGTGFVVAEVDLHAGLVLALRLVHGGGPGQDVDLLVEARVLVEVVVEAAVPALAALVGLLRVVTGLVHVVLVDETGACVDDLAAGAGHGIRGSAVASRAGLLIPRLPRIQVIHLQLRLLPLRALVIRPVADGPLLQAGRPLVGLHLGLPVRLIGLLLELLGARLVVQIVGAALRVLVVLVSVDVLVRATEHHRLAHVRIVVDLAALVVAGRAHASGEEIVLLVSGELGRVLLLVMVLRLLSLVNAVE